MTKPQEAYVMLDATRSVAQSIQHIILRNYADKNNLKITFYGVEFKGIEEKHFQLKQYIFDHPTKNFLLYTIYQFYNKNDGFDLELIKKVISNKKMLYFAAEDIKIESLKDLEDIKEDLLVSHINLSNRDLMSSNDLSFLKSN